MAIARLGGARGAAAFFSPAAWREKTREIRGSPRKMKFCKSGIQTGRLSNFQESQPLRRRRFRFSQNGDWRFNRHFAKLPLAIVIVSQVLAAFSRVGSAAGGDAEGGAGLAAVRARFEAAMDVCAREVVEEAAPSERADAALAVGAIYEMGLVGDPDPMKAASFYGIASDLGSAEADCALGNMYSAGVESGPGRIGRDLAMAVEYYGRAAVGGSVTAMLTLGKLYADGSPEAPRDPKRALAYFMDAASRGNEEAILRVEPIMAEAREWESRRPGRKANFPTRREDLVNPELERADRNRSNRLDKMASRVYVELNRRIAEAVKVDN